ncbi:prolyl oligopeptidase family serine peptidase [Acidobacteriota bacterium]
MTKSLKALFIVFAVLTLISPNLFSQETKTEPAQPKVLEDINDILSWKSIISPTISNNGRWFAYRLGPAEGDSEVFFKDTQEDKVYNFPVGEGPRSASGEIAFSEDSKWAAFSVYPTRSEAKKLAKQKKPKYNNISLVNLSTGDKIDFEKISRFKFSGENPSWIAFQKYPPEGQANEQEKWKGSNLILYELATKKELNIGNVSSFAFNKSGQWLAWIIDAHGQSGNGVQMRNMKSGVILPLDTDKAEYSRLTWTKEGDALIVLKGKEDENFEDKLYSIVGFTEFDSSMPKKTVYDPKEDTSFPEKMTISPNRTPIWTEDFSAFIFGIHDVKIKENKNDEVKDEEKEDSPPEPNVKPKPTIDKEDLPEVVIWHWKDKRMQSQQQVQESRDKNYNYLAMYLTQPKTFIRLADDTMRNVTVAPKHLWAIGYDNREYELEASLVGLRFQDVFLIDMKTGERKLVLKKFQHSIVPSPDGTHFLFYNEGQYHTYEMSTGKTYTITQDIPTSFINTEDDHNVIDPPIRPIGWVKNGGSVLLYDNWDIWNVPVHGGKSVNLTINGKADGIRYRSRFRLDPDEEGIDLTQSVYLGPYGEWTKKAGIGRIDKGKPGVKMLLWEDASFSLRKAKNADVFLYTKQTYKNSPDFYVTDANMKNGNKITDANPQQKDFLWSSGSKLIDYESAKGDKLQAALFLPANYEEGKSYPTIVYIYEKVSQNLNRYYSPSASGFNKSVYTSRGYAVLMPDIVYKINDPGMSSVWCVVPAVEAAIASGIVDKNNIGIHGHSWGGYQSSFLVTQTDLFSAVVTGAPLTNMISMYSSIYWNSGSANQPIFETSQGRFLGGYWDNLEAYARNSPVYFAQNVKTPMIILHNDNDGAVDWNQGIEYFNTLRRLGKPVIMLQYVGENHGVRKPPNQKDYTIRMREFFDHHLLGKPAPEWITEGIAHLELEDHIENVTRKIIEKKVDKKTEVKKKY